MGKTILGAGPSGLCAAINLAKAGENVRVLERREGVGMRFSPNFQGLKYVDEPEEFMEGVGVGRGAGIEYHYFPKSFFGTRNRDIDITVGGERQMALVERGGKHSLEYALYKRAVSLGVEFEFGARAKEEDADIVATGMGTPDGSALGGTYEDTDFPRDHICVIFDDRYSPTGWYCYIIPVGKDRVEFVNCVSPPHVPKLGRLYEKAIAERKIVNHYIGGKKRLASFGGSGSARLPKSAKIGKRYYVGEAAGFQDPFMGFGIAYALLSGHLAAKSIITGEDYDALWKRRIFPNFKTDIAVRFLPGIFGDRVFEFAAGGMKDGQTVDLASKTGSAVPFRNQLIELFFRAECLKKNTLGYL